MTTWADCCGASAGPPQSVRSLERASPCFSPRARLQRREARARLPNKAMQPTGPKRPAADGQRRWLDAGCLGRHRRSSSAVVIGGEPGTLVPQMRDARRRSVLGLTRLWPRSAGAPEVTGVEPRAGCASMSASQQDHASDDRRVEATEAGDQPRFESNLRSPRPRPRRSRLMVKDVGQPIPWPSLPERSRCRTQRRLHGLGGCSGACPSPGCSYGPCSLLGPSSRRWRGRSTP